MSLNPEKELKDFPCTFNLTTGHKVSYQRLKHIKDKVIEDLEFSDYNEEEEIRDLNLLTWVLFCLDEKEKAIEKNDKVLNLTERKNITALGNLIYISCRMGDKIKGIKFYKELAGFKNLDDFDDLKAAALAEQAYSYSRLGGHENYILSRDLFRECTSKDPNNYLWKYGLGLACKRLTNWSVQFTNKEGTNVDAMRYESVNIFFEIAENGDKYLKGLAYAQLVNLRQNCKHHDYDSLFRMHDIESLCDKALVFGVNDPNVLIQCGKSLKGTNLDRSINLLKLALSLKEHTIAYHHLGICLIIKAKNEAKKNAGRGRTRTLDLNKALVTEAIEYYKKAIEISHGENVPAISDLGRAYLSVKNYQSALSQCNIIIDQKGSKFNGPLGDAHTAAGECLLCISEESDDLGDLVNEAKEHFIKALSLNADLISRKSKSDMMSRYVWSKFKDILEKISRLPLSIEQNRLFELVRKYRNNTGVLKLILDHELTRGDHKVIETELKRFLKSGVSEEALAFLNIACTNSSDYWSSSEVKDLTSRVYFAALWSRLVKGSADSTRVFQQLFQLRYGQCVGLVSEDESEDVQTKYCDVVIFTDDRTSKLAMTLCEIFKSVYGIETVYRSKLSVESSSEPMTNRLGQLGDSCSLLLVVLDEDDDIDIEAIVHVREKSTDTNVLLVNWGPDNLNRDTALDLNDKYWTQTKLLMTSFQNTESMSSKDVIEDLFQGNHEAVIRLFCFLVGENFDRRREQCHTSR